MRIHQRFSPRPPGRTLPAAIALLLLVPAGVSAGAAAGDSRENPPSRPLPATTRAPSTPSPPSPSPSPPPSNPGSPGSTSPSPGYSGGGGRSGGYYRHPHHYRYRFYGYGYYWPYSRFYWDYHRPYYPWGLVWYPAYSSDTRLGALDLAVKPWRTEVYVDGEYVGRSGQFDGYPGYLWLTEGSHQLVFYREGWQTVARKVSVRSGPVRTLKITLAEGPSTPPEDLFATAPRSAAAPPAAPRDRDRDRPVRAAPPAARGEERTERDAALDVRGAPARFRLQVAPLDATVYLDGRFLGSAEELSRLHAGMLIEAGEHFVEVQRPGYESERVEFSVAAGEEAEVRVDLETSGDPSG